MIFREDFILFTCSVFLFNGQKTSIYITMDIISIAWTCQLVHPKNGETGKKDGYFVVPFGRYG
jgi:hypothetical protein